MNLSEATAGIPMWDENTTAVWRRARPAVARIRVHLPGSENESRGTAFLIAPGIALTALHVVALRSATPPIFFSESFQLEFPWGSVSAEIIPGALSREHDWVILRLQRDASVRPLPLASPEKLGEGTHGDSFDTFGFPDTAPNSGKAEVGQVRHYEPGNQDGAGSYLQLFCVDAAAGNGEPVQGLSGGPVLVQGAVVGLLRSALLDRDGYTLAGALYACPISRVLENPRAAELLPAPDPISGLPGLPHGDLPSEPYRDLQPYGANDAEIFFGREPEIRALYDIVTAEDAAPIVLLYGQSGVGKSSLLEAGLIPRLKWTYQVSGARRDGLKGLTGTLESALRGLTSGEARPFPDTWRDNETISGKPLLIWLDQIEEVWTRANQKGPVEPELEFADLLDTFDALFGRNAQRPRGKLLLGFRKEFLPEITTGLERRRLPFINWFLQPMKRQSVADVVLGLTRTERLRRQYRLRVEPGLEQTVMERVCSDLRSPVAPTLQIFMTRMWTAAIQRNEGAPLWNRDLLSTIEERSDYLLDFLDRQIASIAITYAEEESSGLLLDILDFHTTDLGTSKERTRDEVNEQYAHVDTTRLTSLLNDLILSRLIADTGENTSSPTISRERTGLIHDTLAPKVRARMDQSQRPGQRARRILEARVQVSDIVHSEVNTEIEQDPIPLASADLFGVKLGKNGMRRWTKAEEALIAVSEAAEAAERAEGERRLAIQRKAENAVIEEAERRRHAERRTRRALQLIVVMLLIGITGSLVLWFNAKHQALARSRTLAESLYTSTQSDISGPVDVTHALLEISQALSVAPNDWPRRDVYIARAAHLSHLSPKSIAPLGGDIASAALSRNGKIVILFRDNGIGEIRDGETGSRLIALEQAPGTGGASGSGQAIDPSLSPSGNFASALVPANNARGGTFVLAWESRSGHLWLHAELPHELAIQPNDVHLEVSDDGWVIARLPAMAYDLGGTPYWTSSAMVEAWHYDARVTQTDRKPDSTWTGRGLPGSFAPDPVDGSRLIYLPEASEKRTRGTGDKSDSVEVGAIKLGSSEIQSFSMFHGSNISPVDVSSIAWSDDGRFVVLSKSGGNQDTLPTIRIYDTATKQTSEIPSELEHSAGPIYDVSASSALTIARQLDRGNAKILVWPLIPPSSSERVDTPSIEIDPSKCQFIAIGPRDESIVAVGDGEIRVIDAHTGALLRPIVRTPGKLLTAAMVDSRATLATISRDGILSKWDISADPSGSELTSTTLMASAKGEGRSDSFMAAAFSGDTSQLVVIAQKEQGYQAGIITIAPDHPLDLPLYPEKWMSIADIFKDPSGEFRNFHSLGFDSTGHLSLAVLTILGQPREMLVANGGKPCVLQLPSPRSSQVFTVDAHTLVTCNAPGCRLWDALTCGRKQNSPELVPTASLDPDFLKFALASSGAVTDASNGKSQVQMEFERGKWRTSSDLNVASKSVWLDDATQLQITPPKAGSSNPHPVATAVSPDGRSVAVLESAPSYSDEHSLEFGAWDTVTGRSLTLSGGEKWPAKSALHASAFSPDGQWLFSLTSDNTLRRHWVLGRGSSSDWVEDATQALTGYRLVGNDVLIPLDASSLSTARRQAIQTAGAAAKRGDQAARIVLDALQRGQSSSSK